MENKGESMNKPFLKSIQRSAPSDKCRDCKYYGLTTSTCDYFMITYRRRGCPVGDCDKFQEMDEEIRARQRAIFLGYKD